MLLASTAKQVRSAAADDQPCSTLHWQPALASNAHALTALPDLAGAVAWLCSHGANVAALKDDNWRDTALHYAAASGSLEACNVLLAYGADAGAVNFAGAVMMQ